MYYRYLFCIITAFVLLASGCTEAVDHKGKTPLVQVGDNYLYMEDVMAVTPPGISEKDSAEMADRYIKNWIDDMLLYAKAEGNIPDDAGINELVNSYRRELITHTYIEQIVSQEVESLIPDSEVEEYYNENKDAFLAVEPYIKGLYIKVPKTASGISQVRQWYKDGSERSVDKIEKYGLRNAVDYEYFYDRWRSVNDFFLRLPTDADKEKNNIGKNKNIELSDSAFYYFLHIEDYLGKGEILPLEYAGKDIREIIMNNKRVEFITKMKKDLYDEACDNNDIKYFNASNE
ncbi:peptidyl-prolyl cis-trans isomerase [Bacteroides caecigallinarum]|uniref:peptidylprolyl isomerase n=1 Tax=Bacteroides caecigallinarum TaxID=1411144 RepID=UPI001F363B2F|nr:peptidylprolyl isomerase [Bacteroides caecigallinarum]MCF2736768.1 peptidyl-prolyl cis-trans isomerase [Bacteroides caecigallinarum]